MTNKGLFISADFSAFLLMQANPCGVNL